MADNVSTQTAALSTVPDTTKIATDQLADGSHAQKMKVLDGTADGTNALIVSAAGAAKVDGSAVTQPVSGTFFQATQPVSGTVTANAGTGPFPVSDNAGSLTVDAPIGTPVWVRESDGAAAFVGQKTMANSKPVVIASDQSAIPASQSGTWTVAGGANVFHVDDNAGSLTVDAPVGTPVAARLSDGAAFYKTNVDTQLPAALVGGRLSVDASGVAVPVTDNAGSLTVDAPVGTPVFARLSDGAAALIGQKAMTASLPVVVASDQSAFAVNQGTANAVPWKALLTDSGGTTVTQVVPANTSPSFAGNTALIVTLRGEGLPTGANVIGGVTGDVDHDAVNTLKNIQIAGHASPADVPPTAVSAAGDRVRGWFDRFGSPIIRRRKIRESYTAVFRLAEAAARLDQTFTQVANTNKQWATLHHTAGATKEVRLLKCYVYITSDTTAGIQGVVELRQISAAPATGNPAITPTPSRRGGTAAEAVALYLPTTAGTEANVNSPLGHVPFDTGISGAVSTANPVPVLAPVVLYDAYAEDPEFMPPVLPVATLDGWAVTVRAVGAPVLRITVVMKFTEEIP